MADPTLLTREEIAVAPPCRHEDLPHKPGTRCDVNRLRLIVADLERQLAEAHRALESLTPGGSEYVADVARCVAFVRDRRNQQHRIIVDFKRRADAAEAKLRAVAALRDELRENEIRTPTGPVVAPGADDVADCLDAILGGDK